MKTQNHNSFEPVSEKGYKKKYLLRKVEEREAQRRVREFDDYDEPNQLDYPERDED